MSDYEILKEKYERLLKDTQELAKYKLKIQELEKENERLNNIINELRSDLKTLWIVLWNMDTEMIGYQNEVFDKYYDEFHKGSDKE